MYRASLRLAIAYSMAMKLGLLNNSLNHENRWHRNRSGFAKPEICHDTGVTSLITSFSAFRRGLIYIYIYIYIYI